MSKRTTKKTAELSRRKYAARMEYIDEVKNQPCEDCGGSFPPCAMDFDHVRGEKRFQIGGNTFKNWDQLLGEIAKCDVVCANCHRIRTWGRKGT